jgi:hypothetical protein
VQTWHGLQPEEFLSRLVAAKRAIL